MQGIMYVARLDSRSKPDSLSAQPEVKVVLPLLHFTSRFSIPAFSQRTPVLLKGDSLDSIAAVVVMLRGLRVCTSCSKRRKKKSYIIPRERPGSAIPRFDFDIKAMDGVRALLLFSRSWRSRNPLSTARARPRWVFCRENPREMCEQGIRSAAARGVLTLLFYFHFILFPCRRLWFRYFRFSVAVPSRPFHGVGFTRLNLLRQYFFGAKSRLHLTR